MLVLVAASIALAMAQDPEGSSLGEASSKPTWLGSSRTSRGGQLAWIAEAGTWVAREHELGKDELLLAWEALDLPATETEEAVDVRFGARDTIPQRLALGFEPTASGFLGDELLFVAGKTPEGRAVLRTWKLGWPREMPEPRVDPRREVVVDGWGKRWVRATIEFARVDLGEARTVLVEPLESRGAITALVPLGDGTGSRELLALFASNAEVATIDLESGLVEVLASGTSHAGRFGHRPVLGTMYPVGLARYREERRGLVYLVEPYIGCVITGETRWFALFDSDLDGRIDDHEVWDSFDALTFKTGSPLWVGIRAENGLPPPARK